ncbi:MAG TPA: ZIP family metal transporter [Burkholderiaceae bacterium]|nr:ZIP family metal transporter [Burkholderiaceae bacterium]
MNPLWLALATVLSTAAGGLCALRLRARLHLLSAFASGVLLGVVAFDLWPESLEQSRRAGGSGHGALLALIAGFVLWHGLRRLLVGGHAHDDARRERRRRWAGAMSALPLVAHSAMDGVAIGLAFQVSPAVGAMVAVAVIAHDFCDGLNTVSVMLLHRHGVRGALAMLALDAIAPLLGAAGTLAVAVPQALLAPILASVAGLLLSIGATELLPQACSRLGRATALQGAGLGGLGAMLIYGTAHWAG